MEGKIESSLEANQEQACGIDFGRDNIKLLVWQGEGKSQKTFMYAQGLLEEKKRSKLEIAREELKEPCSGLRQEQSTKHVTLRYITGI